MPGPEISHWEEVGSDGGSASETDGAKLDRAFDVWMTTAADISVKDVVACLRAFIAEGAPAMGYPHPRHWQAYCVDLGGKRDESDPHLWHVQATYQEPKPQPGQDPQKQDSKPPDEQGAVISSDTEPTEVFDLVDVQGNKIVNVLGNFFDPPLATYAGVQTIPVNRWYPPPIDLPYLTDFANTVNDREVKTPKGIFPRHSLRLSRISTSPKTIRGWHGEEVRMVLHYRRLPPNHMRPKQGTPFHPQTGFWVPTAVLNSGYTAIKGGVEQVVMDKTGRLPKSTPTLLAEDGTELPANAKPVYLHYQQYEAADLSWVFG